MKNSVYPFIALFFIFSVHAAFAGPCDILATKLKTDSSTFTYYRLGPVTYIAECYSVKNSSVTGCVAMTHIWGETGPTSDNPTRPISGLERPQLLRFSMDDPSAPHMIMDPGATFYHDTSKVSTSWGGVLRASQSSFDSGIRRAGSSKTQFSLDYNSGDLLFQYSEIPYDAGLFGSWTVKQSVQMRCKVLSRPKF